MDRSFWPEGARMDTEENRAALSTDAALYEAMDRQTILESRAILCDGEHNLHVELPTMHGIIPREEGALGVSEGVTRDIALISRVSKPICFTVTAIKIRPNGERYALLSRRAAQEQCRVGYLDSLHRGDVLPARVTRLESFGAFCDVGCGIVALLPIAAISVSRISHPSDRLTVGMDIFAVVASHIDGRICLSQRELLGTWEQNAALFSQGETVSGIIRSVEPYGIFVELTPNLAGLAEPHEGVQVGQYAGVYIKNILPEKMKLKLVLIDTHFDTPPEQPLHYFITGGHLDRWDYTPAGCRKYIGTDFTAEPRPPA